MPRIQETDMSTHFNNWPNEQGFQPNYEQKIPVELQVTGEIPAYTAGVLYRTGPGRYEVDIVEGNTFQISHWFDGFSQTHRFQLVAPETTSSGVRVFYNSRIATDSLIEEVRKTGSLDHFSFGQKRDPCKTMFKKFLSSYQPNQGASISNIGVTLSINMPGLESYSTKQGGGRWDGITTLYAETDTSKFKKIHPETLEPIGLAEQRDLHPDLDGPLSASHAKSDPKTGDVYNYNISFTPRPTYRVFRVSAATGETTILATFPATPAYLHSLFLTEDYVIVSVWNAHLSPAELAKGSLIEALQPFDPSQPAKWYVVDRKHGKGLIATYDSRAFFCFHSVNAWQEPSLTDPSKTDIVAECVMFESSDVLYRLYYELLLSNSPKAQQSSHKHFSGSKIARFRLPSIPTTPTAGTQTASVDWTAGEFPLELPTLNPAYLTRPHRYTYAVVGRGESTFLDGILKFDSQTKESYIWHRHAQSPGEPIFIADPKGGTEDAGVLLSVVLDGMTGRSYLLCLDATTVTELGRAQVEGPIGFGFHGQHIPTRGMPTGDF
ncbi:carotenoid oxygenase family protein [Aspergillus alliaceus]|uniref:carotenoid oxygenase family protein n=1 Tax=Petromyces alliaceus TaxID=209559 RepID=UPI0012A70270|nr:dioxygenase [Aspergillus alliaceus]KAB8235703.1 dioxygenase [Aspergillus alliaceus]